MTNFLSLFKLILIIIIVFDCSYMEMLVFRNKKRHIPKKCPNYAYHSVTIHTKSECAKPYGLDTPILKSVLFFVCFEVVVQFGRLQSVYQFLLKALFLLAYTSIYFFRTCPMHTIFYKLHRNLAKCKQKKTACYLFFR